MRTLLKLVAGLGLMASIMYTDHAAAAVCAPSEDLAHELEINANERFIGGGIDLGGNVIEVYAGPNGGSFTVVVISQARPDIACVLSIGNHWNDDNIVLRR